MSDYEHIMSAIMRGDIATLDDVALMLDDFPCGRDDFIHRHWITNAVDCGDLGVVKWMLQHGASVQFDADDGYSVIHSVLEREKADRLAMLRLLIEAGADVNVHGIHDYTPAHMAATKNDVEALKILIEAGADLSVRTRIDEYATPLEEAIHMGDAEEAVLFLQSLSSISSTS